MLSLHIQLELSNDEEARELLGRRGGGKLDGSKIWLKRSTVTVTADRGVSKPHRHLVTNLSGGLGNVVRCLCAISLLKPGESTSLAVGEMPARIASRERMPRPAKDRDDAPYLTEVFPLVWVRSDFTCSSVEEAGSKAVNVVNLMIQKGGDGVVLSRGDEGTGLDLNFDITLSGRPLESSEVESILNYLNAKFSSDLTKCNELETLIFRGSDSALQASSSFTGRQWVIEEFDRFVSTSMASSAAPRSGYFCVMGPPGIGKSAICEHVATTRQLPFVQFKDDNILFPNGTVAKAEAIRNSPSFMSALLEGVKEQWKGVSPIVLVLDGLDEAPAEIQAQIPKILPEGIFILTSCRGTSQSECLLHQKGADVKTALIMPEDPRNKKDVAEFLDSQAGDLAIKAFADDKGIKVDVLLNGIRAKSEGNFMFIRYVLFDIRHERKLYRSIEEIPTGLEGYYEHHVNRLHEDHSLGDEWYNVRLPIITVLMTAKSQYPVAMIAKLASDPIVGDVDVDRAAATLKAIAQFLIKERVKAKGKATIFGYRIYHTDFRRYLRLKADLPDKHGIRQAVTTRTKQKLAVGFMNA